jgi:hypothetical protein
LLYNCNIDIKNLFFNVVSLPFNGVKYELQSITVCGDIKNKCMFQLETNNIILNNTTVEENQNVFELNMFSNMPNVLCKLELKCKNVDYLDESLSAVYSLEIEMTEK